VCDIFDEIKDFNSKQGDKITGECEYKDKGAPRLKKLKITVSKKQEIRLKQ
jgi:hypothetical protein